MNYLKLFLFLCVCITIVYFTWIAIIFIGVLTITCLGVKYIAYRFKNKLGRIFN